MNALILAAGLGTRLKPLTLTMPKAMVHVCGKPLLQHQIERLKKAGCTNIVVNVHHFAEQIIDFLNTNQNFGIDIRISDERQELLNTGGAIKKAGPLFASDEPILVHNVDILHNADLGEFYRSHAASDCAVLMTSDRHSSRSLIARKDDNRLVGWHNANTNEYKGLYSENDYAGHPDKFYSQSFSGIHIFPKTMLPQMAEWGSSFSVIDLYLSVCDKGNVVLSPQSDLRIIDVGKLDTLQQAEKFLSDFNLPIKN